MPTGFLRRSPIVSRRLGQRLSHRRRDDQPDPHRLLALAVAFSAGIHAALVPEHLKEMPALGYSFIVAAAAGCAIAIALVMRPRDRRIALLAGLFCVAQILAWVMLVTIQVPFISGTPEPIGTIALVSKAVELVGVALALRLGAFSQLRRAAQTDRVRRRAATVARPAR